MIFSRQDAGTLLFFGICPSTKKPGRDCTTLVGPELRSGLGGSLQPFPAQRFFQPGTSCCVSISFSLNIWEESVLEMCWKTARDPCALDPMKHRTEHDTCCNGFFPRGDNCLLRVVLVVCGSRGEGVEKSVRPPFVGAMCISLDENTDSVQTFSSLQVK